MDTTKLTPSKEDLRKRLYSKRALIMWTVFLSVAISAAAFFFVVMPQWQRVGPGREFDIAAQEESVSARQRYLDQLKALRANYSKISQTDIELVSRVLPTQRAIPELLQQMESMGRESGLEVVAINVADVAETRATARQQLQAEVGGAAARQSAAIKVMTLQLQISTNRYDRFKAFVNALQSNARIIDVESYVFSTDQEVQSLTAKTYYLPL